MVDSPIALLFCRRHSLPLALMRKPSFAIFIASMFIICIPLYFYFVNMSIYLGQF